MKNMIAAMAALAVAGHATAHSISVKPLIDARLRYEHVEQDAIVAGADAVTVRVRAGASAGDGPFTMLAEAQGTLAIVGESYDGLHGVQSRPLVSDPQNVALYRMQVQYKSKPLTLTVGRQRIALDDERFVGAANFRQNGQTFDAARAELTLAKGFKADLTYARAVRTIWGVDGRAGRPGAIGGDNVFVNASYATRLGTLAGFGYLINQDAAAVQGFRLSSQTYGARFAGSHPLSKGVKLSYAASVATQTDHARNPNRYRADYYLIDGAIEARAARIGAGYEVLSAAHGTAAGAALTSFQTPLATLFKFQGWADKFLATPPNGVRDVYASGTYTVGDIGRLKAVSLQAIGHRFSSDRLGQHYGDELDLLASAKLGRLALSLRGADYWADAFATHTTKAWIQADWAL